MILKTTTKFTITDDDGNIIKEKEYGKAYLTPIDILQSAEDGILTKYYNFDLNNKIKKEQSKETKELYRIVDILMATFKRTMMDKFLCDSGEILEKYKIEIS